MPEVRAESSNVETLLELCARSVGACFCPENLARLLLAAQPHGRLEMLRMPDTMAYPISFGYAKRATHGACWRTSSASPARSIRSRHENTPPEQTLRGMCFGMAYLFQGFAGSGSVGSQPRFGLEMSSHGADGFGTGRDEAL